jgi:hypothetical protein
MSVALDLFTSSHPVTIHSLTGTSWKILGWGLPSAATKRCQLHAITAGAGAAMRQRDWQPYLPISILMDLSHSHHKNSNTGYWRHHRLHQYSCISVSGGCSSWATTENQRKPGNSDTWQRRSIFSETCLYSLGRKSRKRRKPTETYVNLDLCSYVLVGGLSRVVWVSGFPGFRVLGNLRTRGIRTSGSPEFNFPIYWCIRHSVFALQYKTGAMY